MQRTPREGVDPQDIARLITENPDVPADVSPRWDDHFDGGREAGSHNGQKHEVLDARSRHLLDQVAQPIPVEDLLDWSYDNLDANVASDYQREIYEYLLARGMVAS